MNTLCGWACFAVFTGAWALPTSLYLIGHNEIECHQERRLVWVNMQPRTELRPVCGEHDEPHH